MDPRTRDKSHASSAALLFATVWILFLAIASLFFIEAIMNFVFGMMNTHSPFVVLLRAVVLSAGVVYVPIVLVYVLVFFADLIIQSAENTRTQSDESKPGTDGDVNLYAISQAIFNAIRGVVKRWLAFAATAVTTAGRWATPASDEPSELEEVHDAYAEGELTDLEMENRIDDVLERERQEDD